MVTPDFDQPFNANSNRGQIMPTTSLLGTRRFSDPPTVLQYAHGVTSNVRDFECFSI